MLGSGDQTEGRKVYPEQHEPATFSVEVTVALPEVRNKSSVDKEQVEENTTDVKDGLGCSGVSLSTLLYQVIFEGERSLPSRPWVHPNPAMLVRNIEKCQRGLTHHSTIYPRANGVANLTIRIGHRKVAKNFDRGLQTLINWLPNQNWTEF